MINEFENISKIEFPNKSEVLMIENSKNVVMWRKPFNLQLRQSPGGQISANMTSIKYGYNLKLSAIADNDYEFFKWSDNNGSAIRTINISSDIDLQAIFVKKETYEQKFDSFEKLNANEYDGWYKLPKFDNGEYKIIVIGSAGRSATSYDYNTPFGHVYTYGTGGSAPCLSGVYELKRDDKIEVYVGGNTQSINVHNDSHADSRKTVHASSSKIKINNEIVVTGIGGYSAYGVSHFGGVHVEGGRSCNYTECLYPQNFIGFNGPGGSGGDNNNYQYVNRTPGSEPACSEYKFGMSDYFYEKHRYGYILIEKL